MLSTFVLGPSVAWPGRESQFLSTAFSTLPFAIVAVDGRPPFGSGTACSLLSEDPVLVSCDVLLLCLDLDGILPARGRTFTLLPQDLFFVSLVVVSAGLEDLVPVRGLPAIATFLQAFGVRCRPFTCSLPILLSALCGLLGCIAAPLRRKPFAFVDMGAVA
ncbi:MAG: hypothetical protein B7X41_13335, partial [Microbacterium sp. 14-71-5]